MRSPQRCSLRPHERDVATAYGLWSARSTAACGREIDSGVVGERNLALLIDLVVVAPNLAVGVAFNCIDLPFGFIDLKVEMDVLQKRIKIMEASGDEGDEGQGSGKQMTEMGSQDVEEHFQRIFEKVERYTHQVEELLEAGRTLFKNLSPEFEERLISSVTLAILSCPLRVCLFVSFVRLILQIHKEQIEKWQDEIKGLQSRHAANEAAAALLGNAHHLLRSSPQFSIHATSTLRDSEVKSFKSKPEMFAYAMPSSHRINDLIQQAAV
ncbi:hypothetical protein ZIOFF_037730 [Zingiber officinale]|uniref:Uncharacterized protein n=1 Tax=Zingiber officinale TaxID=94328 RepID=A0A8J5L422_ZINOF|nr:hypothetical protein ZIOFF_037730 [Zingiber officinale]